MEQPFLPFAKPSIDEDTIAEVTDCLQSGWITTGPRTSSFEQAMQLYLKAKHTLALNSGTAGLHLALLSLHLEPGDEVITSPLTFAATFNTIVHAGAIPVPVDIDPLTRNIDVNKISATVTSRTKAIVPIHFAGLPVDLDTIYDISDDYGLRVIEDAAHAIGAEYKQKKIGEFGDTQVFSFHPNKNMTTGEGGCVATQDDELAYQIKTMRFHGIDREAWNRYGKKGNQHYSVIAPGYKYNMMDLQAAIGLHQLKHLDTFIDKRTKLVQRYYDAFASFDKLGLPAKPSEQVKHAWHLFTVLIDSNKAGMDRDEFMLQMKQHGIGTGLHYAAVHLYPYYTDTFGFKKGDFPLAEKVCDQICSLPLFPDMTFDEQDRVINTIFTILRR